MLAIVMENLGYKCEVDDGIPFLEWVVADVLEFQVAVRESEFVNDLQLSYQLHSHF